MSARWDAAVRAGYTPVASVTVWRDGVQVASLTPLPGGKVTLDEGSRRRRVVTLSTADDMLTELTQERTDLRVACGIEYGPGDIELVDQGVFRVIDAVRKTSMSPITVEAEDYSGVCALARFMTPWATAGGVLVVDEIAAMIHDVDPSIDVVDETGSLSATTAGSWDRDRWGAVEALAASIGAEVAFDRAGRCVIRLIPTVTDATVPVWTIDADHELAVLVGVTYGSSGLGYNAVVATSGASGGSPPVTAVALGASYGPGSQRPRFLSLPSDVTLTDAAAAAAGLLARSEEHERIVDPQAVPNPALDVGDAVRVRVPSDGVDEVRIITALELPLGLEVMSVRTRRAAPYQIAGSLS